MDRTLLYLNLSKAIIVINASIENNKDKMEVSPVVDGTDVMMSVTFCVSAWSELLRRVYLRLESGGADCQADM